MSLLLEFNLQEESVAADVEWDIVGEAGQPCSGCSKHAVIFEYTMERVYHGREEIPLNSRLGRVIAAYVREKLLEKKPICTDCWQKTVEKEFPVV